MAFFEKSKQAVPNETRLERRKRERTAALAVVAALAVLAVFGTLLFYRYLDNELFRERGSHFIELSDQVTEVIESEVKHYRSIADTAENLLADEDVGRKEEIPAQLEKIRSCLNLEQGTVLACDDRGQIYVSDGTSGIWQETAVLSDVEGMQEIMLTLDPQTDDASYILFVKKLDTSLNMESGQITHVGVGVALSVFQEAFDADLFQGQSHVYVIGPDGSRLYRHVCEGGFIDSYNVLGALQPCPFIHGGTLEDLRKSVLERKSAGYELNYNGERYFVASSPVHETDWSVLTFVPTKTLGAGTRAFLNTAVVCVSAIAVVVALMFGLLVFFFLAKKEDRRLIEHQRQANEQLQDAAAAANAASMAKSDFLSHMSHDIRTPINGIMGMTDIALKNVEDPEKVFDCLKKIESSSGHLLSLVNDVLDMSRIENGKIRISREPVDILLVARHCASIIGGQLEGRDVELKEEFEALSHPHVLGDELHLRQVLINILGNAVKFTPDGGTIYFRVGEASSDGKTAVFRIEVEDTGIGMKPEFLPHIFEPFAQEDDGTRSNYKGTGLGMAITKQFVDLMGGSITVESRLNAGSRFTVEIPAEIDREYKEPCTADMQEAELKGLRVLLAEDNELNMEIAQYILEEAGIEAVCVTDGQAALEAFKASRIGEFDGILMDVMMPVMDGLAATRAIRALDREDAKTIPVIAMTANAYDEDKRRCLEAGMNAHVAKPVAGDMLIRVLSQHVRCGCS